jgi:hypothetical protein
MSGSPAERVDAYVIGAQAPRALNVGHFVGHPVHVVYRDASGRLVMAKADKELEEEQWIVAGMTVPFEPYDGSPTKGRIVLDEIPPLSERIAACDPPLCELESVWLRLRSIARELGGHALLWTSMYAKELGWLFDEIAGGPAWSPDEQAVIERMLAERPQSPVVDAEGRLRGTADLVSMTGRPEEREDPTTSFYEGKMIVRVWLYGQTPYPVLRQTTFDPDDHRTWLGRGRVPVSVSQQDRNDVRFLWDEDG